MFITIVLLNHICLPYFTLKEHVIGVFISVTGTVYLFLPNDELRSYDFTLKGQCLFMRIAISLVIQGVIWVFTAEKSKIRCSGQKWIINFFTDYRLIQDHYNHGASKELHSPQTIISLTNLFSKKIHFLLSDLRMLFLILPNKGIFKHNQRLITNLQAKSMFLYFLSFFQFSLFFTLYSLHLIISSSIPLRLSYNFRAVSRENNVAHTV